MGPGIDALVARMEGALAPLETDGDRRPQVHAQEEAGRVAVGLQRRQQLPHAVDQRRDAPPHGAVR